jgi:vacuolar-type H+-ATPase subunit E/Vma4
MKLGRLGIILISCLLIASFLLGGTAYAQDDELPNPGITPDSPFYIFDKWGKDISLFFTFGNEAKARKALRYAEERLAEAQAMAAKNRLREMTRAADEYNGFMAMVNERAEEAIQHGADDNLTERVALATAKHLAVLDRIKDKVPEQAKEAMAHARELSLNGQENALRALSKIKPGRALDITDAIIESRLNRAMAKATENITEEVTEALEDADKLAEIEDEIARLAQELSDNTTAQKLAQATSNRLEVLARVYEKVPETARPAIEKAMENSVSKYERAVVKLQGNNALDTMLEKAPIPQQIKEKVREQISNNKTQEKNIPPGQRQNPSY